ncbi:MAG: hypothetical protein WB823_11005 [Steroidobacteraceae bacterium]
MSAAILELRPRARALDVPAIITASVNLLVFTEALARAGLVGRHDAARGALIIEPATPAPRRCPECGGTGFDEDALCDFCDGTGREEVHRPS